MKHLGDRLARLEAVTPNPYTHLTDAELEARLAHVRQQMLGVCEGMERNGEWLPVGWRDAVIRGDANQTAWLRKELECAR